MDLSHIRARGPPIAETDLICSAPLWLLLKSVLAKTTAFCRSSQNISFLSLSFSWPQNLWTIFEGLFQSWVYFNRFICKALIFPQENQRFTHKVIGFWYRLLPWSKVILTLASSLEMMWWGRFLMLKYTAVKQKMAFTRLNRQVSERIEWFIEAQTFLIRLHARPLPLPLYR